MGIRGAREWEHIEPGRCEHLQDPSTPALSVCVLDAPTHLQASSPFAAILVPRGRELDWVFCAPNGLWDLLFSASVSRLVVLRRLYYQHGEEEEEEEEEEEQFCVHPRFQASRDVADHVNVNSDDAAFEESMRALLHRLFPWSICSHGPAPDPFVVYEDNVRTRMIVEIRNTEALGGGILVEDVELDGASDDDTSLLGERRRILRRRMRFRQMPNLIQTEVPIAIYENGQLTSMHGLEDVKEANYACTPSVDNENVMASRKLGEIRKVELEVRVDHSKLVHKYLPPIVAGLVLASPCFNACIAANVRARVLAIGLGGGALPIFLHRQFGFSVLAVDTDETVLKLACSHFGLVKNEHLQVRVMDGVDAVFDIAHQVCKSNTVKIISESESIDARMHAIIVDVNVDDARSGLLSPPPCFFSKAFLEAVGMALHGGGMLVMNVIPRTKHNLSVVVNSLRTVFSGIYKIQIEDNCVLFAFRSKIADIDMSGVFATNVAHAIGDGLFDKIEEIEDVVDV